MGRRASSSLSNTNPPPKMMTRAAAASAAAASSAAGPSSSDHPSIRLLTVGAGDTSLSEDCPSRPEPVQSPAKCAICLCDLVNRCYTNSCIHQFCFGCLLEWSKIKAECPLCKSNFQSIYHNIRSNDDYDEYHIPTNVIPHLSIRVTTNAADVFRPGPGSYRFDSLIPPTFHRVIAPASPFHDHGYSFQRMVRDRERSERQNQNLNNSYIRILEVGPVSEPSALDFMSSSSSTGPRTNINNPFYAEEPELFGSIGDAADSVETEASLRGYQNRRRIYDRGQFVQPFEGTLPAGTVFFPSVEYFRTHPSSYGRVTPWLYREIMVLMGMHRSRTDMGYVFDVIFGLLLRYDIRSREFREMINAYFGLQTRHFQHEFYHFLLSGMRMEEYDRLARYTQPCTPAASSSWMPTSSTRTATYIPTPAATNLSTSTTAINPSSSPVVVTISDSDSESETDSVEQLQMDNSSPSSTICDDGSATSLFNSRRPLSRFSPTVSFSGPILCPEASGHMHPLPHLNVSMPRPHRDCLYGDRTPNESQQSCIIRPTPAHENNGVTCGFRVNSVPVIANHSRNLLHRQGASTSLSLGERQPPNAHSNNELQLDDWESTFNALSRFRVVCSADGSYNSCSPPQPIDGRRFADSRGERMGEVSSAVRDGRERCRSSSSRNDLERPRCPVESGHAATAFLEPRPRARIPVTDFDLTDLRFNQGMTAGWSNVSASQLTSTSASIAPAPTCSRNFLASPSIANPISDAVVPANISTRPNGEIPKKTEEKPATPPTSVVEHDDDEVEMLGIHPVVKPPPLAVITLSSDDEEDNEKKPKVEQLETVSSLSLKIPGVVRNPAQSKSNENFTSSATEIYAAFEVRELPGVSTRKSARVSLNLSTSTGSNADEDFEVIYDSRSETQKEVPSTFKRVSKKCNRMVSSVEDPGFSKRRKKRVKYTTPEFVDVTDSSSSTSSFESDEEIDVSTLLNEMRKKRKEKKRLRSRRSTSLTSSCKKSRRHRKSKKCYTPPPQSDRQKSISKTISSLCTILDGKRIPKEPSGSKTPVKFGISDRNSDEAANSSNSTLEPCCSKAAPTTASSSRKLASVICFPSNSQGQIPSSSTQAPAALSSNTSPSTEPGTGVLDLRQFIEAKRRGANQGNGKREPIFSPRSGIGRRWESGEDEEARSDISEDENLNFSEHLQDHDSDSSVSFDESDDQMHARHEAAYSREDRSREPIVSITSRVSPLGNHGFTKFMSPIALARLRESNSVSLNEESTATFGNFFLDDSTTWHSYDPTMSEGTGLDLSIGSLHSPPPFSVPDEMEVLSSSSTRRRNSDSSSFWTESAEWMGGDF